MLIIKMQTIVIFHKSTNYFISIAEVYAMGYRKNYFILGNK